MESPSISENPKPTLSYGGAVLGSGSGPLLGLNDIGESEAAYFARVSMPGLKRADCKIRCQVSKEGLVEIRGNIPEEGAKGDGDGVFLGQMYQPGPFHITFELPGPVDPRLCSYTFRGDGILEMVVKKRRDQAVPADSVIPPTPSAA